jgi:hypothetical protein
MAGLTDDTEDEALASAARARYLHSGIASLEPDWRVRSALGRGELLLAERPRAAIDRLANGGESPMSGRLAVTSERLILLKRSPVTLAALEDVDDISLIADRLQVLLTTGAAFAIRALRPRLLQVELAEARAEWFDRQAGRPVTGLPAAPRVVPRR